MMLTWEETGRRFPIYDLLDDTLLLDTPPSTPVAYLLEDMISLPELAHSTADSTPLGTRTTAAAETRNTQGDSATLELARENNLQVHTQPEPWPFPGQSIFGNDGALVPTPPSNPQPMKATRHGVGELIDIS